MLRAGAWRQETGQIAADTMGLMLLAALVVAAGVPERVAGGINQAICTIQAGTDCGEPGPGGGYAEDPYPDSGLADREIYDDDCQGDVPDDAAREGDEIPVGDDQVDAAYERLGRVYDYYWQTYGWDSYDGNGAPVVGVVNYCDGGADTGVSSWSDGRVRFAPGAGDALDTAAHELTHGVTESTAGLEYQCQSGALNESISDIMAWNLDPSDPTYGEDRDGGVIPDYRTPTRFDQPMHVDDYVASANDRFGDWGGVHTNSGIPNHAYLTEDELAEVAARAGDLSGAESALTVPPQPDALSYRFTYGGKQVETDSGALPDELEPLIGTFIELIDRYGPA